MTKHNRCTKVTLVRFLKNFFFYNKWPIWGQFGPKLYNFAYHNPTKLEESYATLCLMIFCNDFLKCFSMTKQNRCTKVTLVNSPKNIPVLCKWAGVVQLSPILRSLSYHDSPQRFLWNTLAWWETIVREK